MKMCATRRGSKTSKVRRALVRALRKGARGKRVRRVSAVFFIIVVPILGYAAFSLFIARNEVKEYCSQLRSGTDVATMRSLAESRGLRFVSSRRADEQGHFTVLVTKSGTFGRHVCTVEHDGDKVTRAKLDFHD
jgi:hypothetical protein